MYNVCISGCAKYVPEKIVKNEELTKYVETTDEWITSRTGIKERRISLNQNTSDLAYEAAKQLDYKDVDAIIVATFTPDRLAPVTANFLAKKLGLENVSAFDLGAGCSGFVYAMEVATGLIQANIHKKVLVVGSEVISKEVDWNDRNTCILFGDGAGAVILERSEEPKVFSTYTKSKSDIDDVLSVGGVPFNNLFNGNDEEPSMVVQMDGTKVYKFAVGAVADGINNALTRANLTLDDIKVIIPHQANERIINAVSKGTKIPLNKFFINIGSYGNTSSASIPIALAEAIENKVLKKGDKALLVGFGAGLAWGSLIFEL